MALAAADLLPRRPLPVAQALRTSVAGLDLVHPVGLAAGLDKDARHVAGLFRLGFSFIEVGTVTPRPQAGNPSPRLFRLVPDAALINRMGFNNLGLEALVRRLARRPHRDGPLGINIGTNRDSPDPVQDYLACFEAVAVHADYITVNVSSPNTPGLRALQSPARLTGLLGTLLRRRDELSVAGRRVPIFVKLAPDLSPSDEVAIAEALAAAAVDGIILTNTTVARPADLQSAVAREAGGLSGRPLFGPSTDLLRRMRRHLGPAIPLIGVGGIASAEDAYLKIRAGASAVQVYTGLIYEGPGLVARLVKGLVALLKRDGFTRLEEACGLDA